MSEKLYFRAIEDAFIELRGAPFLLSPADWRMVEGWWTEGIPLAVVLSALAEVFARREERGEGRKVQSLRYCAAAVEEAWRRRRELGGARQPVADLELDVAERLERLAARLPIGLARRGDWSRRIRAVGADPRQAEAALAVLDAELLNHCLESLEAAARAEIEAEAANAVAAMAGRMDSRTQAADRRRLVREGARRRAGLPLLSLFSPDARSG